MGTAIHTYRIDPRKSAAFKRQSNIALLVPYLFPIGLIIYQLVNTGFNYRFIILSAAVAIIAVTLLFYSIKKSNKRIDTMTLEVSDDTIALNEPGKPGQQIKVAEIKAVETSAKGLELKAHTSLKNPFIIYSEFEKFDQIKKLIEAKAAKNKR